MNEFDYYLLYTSNILNSPAVLLDDDMDEIMIEEPIGEDIEVIKLKFWEPYPKKPIMVDFHHDGEIDAISTKIFNVLQPLEIEGVQLLPATILDPRNSVEYDNYYFLHICNYIECFDYDKSEYTGKRDLGTLGIVKKNGFR